MYHIDVEIQTLTVFSLIFKYRYKHKYICKYVNINEKDLDNVQDISDMGFVFFIVMGFLEVNHQLISLIAFI